MLASAGVLRLIQLLLGATQIPAHLDAFPTQAATADALQFFDTLGAGPHGANNGALYDAHKHPKNQFKVAGSATQQLMSSKYPHHGYSTQVVFVCVCVCV